MSTARGARSGARQRAYTLVELLSVFAVLAIVAAFAVPRMFDRTVFAARGYAADIAGAARLARRIAMTSGCPTRLTIDADGYRASQPRRRRQHCSATSTSFRTSVLRFDGTALAARRPAGVESPDGAQWTFRGDGSAQISGDSALRIGQVTLSIDAASGRVSGP